MKKLLVYALLLSLVVLASCNKFLDLKPQDGIVGNEFWNTKEQVEAAVIGIYSSMQASSDRLVPGINDRAASLPELMFLWGEGRGDMVTPAFRADQDEQDMVNLNMLPTNKYVSWRLFYQTINYCNTVIDKAPGVLDKDKTFSQVQLDRAVGEALTIRALMYFYLVRSFRDVPLKLNATVSDVDVVNIPKSSADTVLTQIIADLKKAEAYLPLTYGSVNKDKGRVTRYAVNALLADVYMWTDKYTEAVTECDKIINSKNFGLVSGRSFFNDVFLRGNSNESIFELQFDVQRLNPFFYIHSPGAKRWGAAVTLSDELYGVDLVSSIPVVDVRGEYAAYRPTDLTILKYIAADEIGNTVNPDQASSNWIFYRYADILLLKAEALNQLNQPLEASRIVKTIRSRANALDVKVMDSTSKSGMTTFILEERQREFAFEGKRWYDVLRVAKRNNYENLNLLLNMAAKSIPGERRQAAFAKLRDKNSHYFPIFVYEMQTNKLLEQNPFYK